ncbi:MAG: DUF1385 domain-containing protein [Candidatus Zipacnadales bacterium]
MRYRFQVPYLSPPADSLEVLPRPDHISGLALLRGVFLSAGNVRSGSDGQLVAAGIGFIMIFSCSTLLAYIAVYLLGRLLPDIPLVAIYTYAEPVTLPDPYLGWRIGVHLIRFLAFLIMLRISPIAGNHGAEHKVVNAIEQTGSVDEEVVRRMPPQHLRCGTNLLAGIAPVLLAFTPDVAMPAWLLAVLLFFGMMFRQQIGWVVQTVFTTKEPSPAQLRRGIESGRRLLEEWRAAPLRPTSIAERLWHRGLPQMVVGLACGSVILHLGSRVVYWALKLGL